MVFYEQKRQYLDRKVTKVQKTEVFLDEIYPLKERTMPKISTEYTKRYYSIGEVAALFEVNASAIRFWEKEFSELSPKKNARGVRMYTPEDIEKLRRVYHLVKERGFTLKGARKKWRDNPSDVANQEEVVRRLMKVKDELLAFKQTLA